MGTSKTELTKVLYRSILRFANANQDVPFKVRSIDVAELVPQLGSLAGGDLEGGPAVRQLARQSFRHSKVIKDDGEASAALDTGFDGLRLLNQYYGTQIRDMRQERKAHKDCTGIGFPIGQVFLHRRHGYRGVVFGWDRVCAREPGWAASMNVEGNQPFYKVLPDEDDCQRLYGAIRINKYVAQENIMPISVPRRCTHRLIDQFFTGYSPSQMRYIPTKQVMYEYPDDYAADDAMPCREDSNILRLGQEGSDSSGNYMQAYRPTVKELEARIRAMEPD